MENFNGTLNGGQEETSLAKGIIFALIGMLIGLIPYLILGGMMGERWWYVGGLAVGFCISLGWSLGKGPTGAIRRLMMISLSILGGVTTIILGYAMFFYDLGLGMDFMHAVEITLDFFSYGFEDIFGIYGEVTFDVLGAIVVAIAVSWKSFDLNSNDDDLEELDNDLEDLDNQQSQPTNTAMDDVLNQGVPTLNDDVLNEDIPTLDLD